MPGGEPVVVSGAVEGLLDEAVLKRLISHAGGQPGPIYGRKGKAQLLLRLPGYNLAAQFAPWAVLVDLDQDGNCAPPILPSWLAGPSVNMCFRIAVREVEAWLLADREHLAHFLAVPPRRIPADPETLASPKDTMTQLAQKSRRREVREDMSPRPGSGRRVGPAYSSRLIQFVADLQQGWRPDIASQSADSLRRCVKCLERLVTHVSLSNTEQ
jgi:hypothetical protein